MQNCQILSFGYSFDRGLLVKIIESYYLVTHSIKSYRYKTIVRLRIWSETMRSKLTQFDYSLDLGLYVRNLPISLLISHLIWGDWCKTKKENEPAHVKTNKLACAPSEDINQPGHLSSLISLCCEIKWEARPKLSSCGQLRLIWLGWCPGWSDSSLGARANFLVLSCAGSNVLITHLVL